MSGWEVINSTDGREVVAMLKERRLGLGLMQKEVAERMGVVQSSMSHWERGSVLPKLDSLVRWAAALDATLVVGVVGKGSE